MTLDDDLKQAVQLHQAGWLEQAEVVYRRILAAYPGNVDAMHLLGVLASQTGHHDDAVDLIGRAVVQRPRHAEYHFNLGLALVAGGKWERAIVAFRQAVAIEPRHAGAWSRLGDALYETGHVHESIVACRRALMVHPDLAEAHQNLGKALHAKGDLEGAIISFRKALSLRPQYAAALNNLGQALSEKGEWEEGIHFCRRSIACDEKYAPAHWNLSGMLLRQGEWESGWSEYEWRWKHAGLGLVQPYPHTGWDGRDLNGLRILLHAEQGMGDAIQFVRYIPLVAQRGGTIVGACPAALKRLFGSMLDVRGWLTPGDTVPPVDLHCPMNSLPGIFATELATIPATVPYLWADGELSARWRGRVAGLVGRKVGLVWANRPTPPGRCPPVEAFSELGKVEGVQFVSLQKESEDMPRQPLPFAMTDWTDELNDFMDTAALIDNLDLVITVDTAVAHLAGAMGKPVWLLLKFVADWRWLSERNDSPWYPTMRLFRQPKMGDWQTPIGQMISELQAIQS